MDKRRSISYIVNFVYPLNGIAKFHSFLEVVPEVLGWSSNNLSPGILWQTHGSLRSISVHVFCMEGLGGTDS